MEIKIRKQEVKDAERFYEILNNPNFDYFRVRPESIEAEKEWLEKNNKRRKDNFSYNYAILYEGKVVGGIGIKIDQHRDYIGEVGYFVDEDYWGRGIATEAVKSVEKIGFEELGLKKLKILMMPENKASKRVAEKNGYEKEGLLKKEIELDEEYKDAYLFGKVK